ncbi:MAG: hypothetical protein ACOVNL_07925 [Prochlorococcaceae cyanobacterium]|jgi:hypothetical protein
MAGHPLVSMAAWSVFTIGTALKIARLARLVRSSGWATPGRIERFRASLEFRWQQQDFPETPRTDKKKAPPKGRCRNENPAGDQ